MPAPTPDALRRTVIRMLVLGLDIRLIMAISGLSERTIRDIKRRWIEMGEANAPEQVVMGRPRLLGLGDIWYICERITQAPDLFLDEIRNELSVAAGVEVSLSTVWRTLSRLGITRKVLDKRAMERCEADRAEYRRQMRAFLANQLVFADECSINRRVTYRNRGYAMAGERATMKSFFVRGKRYSILPALSLSGILTVHIVQGSFNTALYLEFIELCLANMNPFPGNNSVLVMDNCPIHMNARVREMIEARGMVCVYLPAYSPDFNPIELAFSKIKTSIRRAGEEARAALNAEGEEGEREALAMLIDHIYSVTEEDAAGWFRHCGYQDID